MEGEPQKLRTTMNATRFLRVSAGRIFLLIMVFFATLAMAEPSVLAHGEDRPEMSPSDASHTSSPSPSSAKAAGLQAACWALSMPYGATKIAYAVGGGVVGTLAWAVTGGNSELAKSIWISSMTGDYIIQPQHLTGEKRLFFVGGSSEESL
jgi:hypothetical protein